MDKKEGDLIQYRDRDAFKKEFGHAVTPDKNIQRLASTPDLGFIPTPEFRKKFDEKLKHFCETDSLITSIIWQANNYVISQNQDINDNFDQKLCQSLHDSLLGHLDHKLISLAYLIKISGFMSSLSSLYRGEFCYHVKIENVPEQIYSLYFTQLEDKGYLLDMINESIDATLPTLEVLRSTFTSETRTKRKSSACKDEFSKKFLRCKEVQERDMPDRLEYLFFETYKTSIDLTPIRHKNVARYLAKQRCNEKEQWRMYTDIKTGKISSLFPGITLSREQDKLTQDVRHDLVFKMQHIIPKTGLILG